MYPMLSEKCPFGHRYYDLALVLYYELLCYSFSRCSVTCNLQLNVTGCVVSSVLNMYSIHAYCTAEDTLTKWPRATWVQWWAGAGHAMYEKYVCHVHMHNERWLIETWLEDTPTSGCVHVHSCVGSRVPFRSSSWWCWSASLLVCSWRAAAVRSLRQGCLPRKSKTC